MKGIAFVNRRYPKGVPFLSNVIYERVRAGSRSGASHCKSLFSTPWGHKLIAVNPNDTLIALETIDWIFFWLKKNRSVYLWPWGRLSSEILAYNKSALRRSASPAFIFVSFYTSSDAWLQHLFTCKQKEPVSFIFPLRGPLLSNSFS